jgi:hypothetical protein
MRCRLLDDNVPMYRDSEGTSEPFVYLPAGTEFELTQVNRRSTGDWSVIRLDDQQIGVIPGKTNIFSFRIMQLAQDQVPFHYQPGSAELIDTLKQGVVVTRIDVVTVGDDKWMVAQDASGRVGYIHGKTKFILRESDVVLDEFVPKSVAQRNMVIGGLACVGGTAVTIWSFIAPEKNGGYIVAWGAILFGAIQFLMGLQQFRKGDR